MLKFGLGCSSSMDRPNAEYKGVVFTIEVQNWIILMKYKQHNLIDIH